MSEPATLAPNRTTPAWADTRGTAIHSGIAEDTLKQMRCRGAGPPFVRIGRRVLYNLADVDNWLRRHRRRSTRDQGAFLA